MTPVDIDFDILVLSIVYVPWILSYVKEGIRMCDLEKFA